MGYLHTEATVRGSRGAVELRNGLIDTGITHSVLPDEIPQQVGAWGPMPGVEAELEKGHAIKATACGGGRRA